MKTLINNLQARPGNRSTNMRKSIEKLKTLLKNNAAFRHKFGEDPIGVLATLGISRKDSVVLLFSCGQVCQKEIKHEKNSEEKAGTMDRSIIVTGSGTGVTGSDGLSSGQLSELINILEGIRGGGNPEGGTGESGSSSGGSDDGGDTSDKVSTSITGGSSGDGGTGDGEDGDDEGGSDAGDDGGVEELANDLANIITANYGKAFFRRMPKTTDLKKWASLAVKSSF